METPNLFEFANENLICYLATMDGEQPRVRPFLIWFADPTGFYFSTVTTKSVCRQMQAHPPVEVCFYDPREPPQGGRSLRVAGSVEFLNDRALKERLFKERPFLASEISGPDDPTFAVFRIPRGVAWFWTQEDALHEREVPRISFGGEE